jgi:hypothetical protein
VASRVLLVVACCSCVASGFFLRKRKGPFRFFSLHRKKFFSSLQGSEIQIVYEM